MRPIRGWGERRGEWRGAAGPMSGPDPIPAREAVASSALWALRLLVLAGAAYLLARLLALLDIATIPLIIALLLTAVLAPVRDLLQRLGLPRLPATLLAFVLALVVLAGFVTLIAFQVSSSAARLTADATQTLNDVKATLAHGLFGLGSVQFSQLQSKVTGWLNQHRTALVSTAYAGINVTLRLLVGGVLTALLTLLLLWDGDRLWRSLSGAAGPRWSAKLHDAGNAAWHTLSGYVRGTLVIATFHGVVIGTTLLLLGVPLAAVLALAVFVGSFVPIVGALVAGGGAVLVTLATKGLVDAAIVLAVLVAASQVEAHVLQPVVMRRFVRLHPIVTVLAITAFGVVWGVAGALIAVPLCAIVARATPVLLGRARVDESGLLRPVSAQDGPEDGPSAEQQRAAPSAEQQPAAPSAEQQPAAARDANP